MQITRWPSASSCSHRCEPRNPAPPVTTQVLIGVGEDSAGRSPSPWSALHAGGPGGYRWPARRGVGAAGAAAGPTGACAAAALALLDARRGGLSPHRPPLLALRRRRRGRLPARGRDPADQGARPSPVGARGMDAGGHPARGARGAALARATARRQPTERRRRSSRLACERPGPAEHAERRERVDAAARGARRAEARRAPRDRPPGARLLLRRDRRALRLDLHQGVNCSGVPPDAASPQ